MNNLEIKNLHVLVGDKEIIRGLDLTINTGEVHAIMGPNGSGKSTLANALAGHPKYEITAGKIIVDGKNLTGLGPDKIARAGVFLSMQHPPEIDGVTVNNFLRTASETLAGEKHNPIKFYNSLLKKMVELKIDKNFSKRYLNVGFSGGEKKAMEIIQLLTLRPSYAILDEIDSGLDVDALKMVARGINRFCGPKTAVLLITHYNRILKLIRPDYVHIMKAGQIVKSGGPELAIEVEKRGYK